uniref:Venom redulysin 4 n=1 Tax=Oncocephalus sp. TaxID=2944721 RepID=A0AB38ZEI1_9HEMI
MSKLWLLLLLVAAFQAVHSFPALDDEYLEDPAETTWSILKDTFNKLKDKYAENWNQLKEKSKENWAKLKEKSKEKYREMLSRIQNKLCTQQDVDLDFEEDDSNEVPLKVQILQKIRELLRKVKTAAGAEKEKLKQLIKDLTAKLCDRLSNDYEEDDDDMEEDPAESTWSILKQTFTKLKDKYKENWSKLKEKAKQNWSKLKEKTKEKYLEMVKRVKEKICTQQDVEEDMEFEEDTDFEEDEEGQKEVPLGVKLLNKLRELLRKIKSAIGDKKDKLKEEIQNIKAKFCSS